MTSSTSFAHRQILPLNLVGDISQRLLHSYQRLSCRTFEMHPQHNLDSQPNSIHSIFPSHSFRPPLSPSSNLIILLHRTTMTGNSESRYIRLEVIDGKNLRVASGRIPAGIYIFINVDSKRRLKSIISVLSSDEPVAWSNTVTLSSHASPTLSLEIRASFELGRMLGGGEVIGKLEMSWDELLDHGDEPFDLSFPPVCSVHPSLTLKAAVEQACDDHDCILFDSLIDCDIARDTDAGHAQFSACDKRGCLSPERCRRTFSIGSGPVSGQPSRPRNSSHQPASRATFEIISKTSMPLLPSSATPLHCARSTIPIIPYLYSISPNH
ncbi:hypothetical protein EV424DRAFT_223796 [Suillus variegatus]|nr:hypothetical protein EV424DRAFT_223796 [Suillus variegatus]